MRGAQQLSWVLGLARHPTTASRTQHPPWTSRTQHPPLASRTLTTAPPPPPPREGKLANKVALITGSTDGIGLAMARRLGQDGASVVVSSRKTENVDRAVAELRGQGIQVHGITCHVGDPQHRENLVNQTVEKFGGIDIFVSNAAVNPITRGIMNCPESVWDKVMDVNLKSPYLLTQMIVPHMRQRGGGAIVYVTTAAAYIAPLAMGSYCVSKTGLLSLMKVLSQELAPDNIRINCLAPGLINTKFLEYVVKTPRIYDSAIETIPMKRLGEAEEMGASASFLCSDDSSYMTGETIVMAGGVHTRI